MSKASRLLLYVCLPCLAVCLAFVAQAGKPHSFGGFYTIIKATPQGENVQVKLSLHITNYTGVDVKDATISLKSSLPHPENDAKNPESVWESQQPTFKDVTLYAKVRKVPPPLEATFTVPAREYQQWTKGALPKFVIEFQDAEGKTQQEPVELMEHP